MLEANSLDSPVSQPVLDAHISVAETSSQSVCGTIFPVSSIPVTDVQDYTLSCNLEQLPCIATSSSDIYDSSFQMSVASVISVPDRMDVDPCTINLVQPSDGPCLPHIDPGHLAVNVTDINDSDSGAEILQSAPTAFMLQKHLPERGDPLVVQVSTSNAIQLDSASSFGTVGPVGLLPAEREQCSPSREQIPNQNTGLFISNLKNLQNRCENLNFDISAAAVNTAISEIISLQELQSLNSLVLQPSCVDRSVSEKLLCPNLGISEPPAHKMSINSGNNQPDASIINTNIASSSNSSFKKNPAVQHNRLESNNKANSYSRALAPPNVVQETTGSAPECGVVVDRVPGQSLDSYAWAIFRVLGEHSISFIGRYPKNDNLILFFLKSKEMAEELVSEGIWLRGNWLNVSYFQKPATKLIVSGVMPFVPDGTIIDAFAPYGTSVFSFLKKIPAAVRDRHLKGMHSYRREIYIIKTSPEISFPATLDISFLGLEYELEISTTGAKCFACGSLYHTIARCDHQEKSEVNEQTSSLLSKEKLSSSTPGGAAASPIFTAEKSQLSKSQELESSSSPSILNSVKVATSVVGPTKRDFFTQCNLLKGPKSSVLSVPVVGPAKTSNLVKRSADMAVQEPVTKAMAKGQQKSDHHRSKELIVQPNQEDHLDEKCARSISVLNQTTVTSQQLVSSDGESPDSVGFPGVKKKPRKSLNIPIKEVSRVFQSTELNTDMALLDKSVQDTNENMQQDVESSSVSSADDGQHKNNRKSEHTNCLPGNLQVNNESKPLKLSKNDIDTGQTTSLQSATGLIGNWLKKSERLKNGPKNNLALQMIQSYSNLEEIISAVLSIPDLYPPASAKGRRIRDLLQQVRASKQSPRKVRQKKRR